MEVEVEVENGYSGLVNSRFSRGIASTGRRGMGMKGGGESLRYCSLSIQECKMQIYKYAI